ncbi:hypothetical protein BX600DRAFT_442759 [Xylariales sp. PMI_506]|nr:hypothetical protein BX600DRAFT_442759 [Xylariales sp. PMI_506]
MPWGEHAGKQLKQPDEYSTNPNTMRARRRKASLNPLQRVKEEAKASDAKAVARACKICSSTEAFKQAGPEERNTLLENAKVLTMQRRRNKGYDAETKIAQFINRSVPENDDSPGIPSIPHNVEVIVPANDGELVLQNLGEPHITGLNLATFEPMQSSPYGTEHDPLRNIPSQLPLYLDNALSSHHTVGNLSGLNTYSPSPDGGTGITDRAILTAQLRKQNEALIGIQNLTRKLHHDNMLMLYALESSDHQTTV